MRVLHFCNYADRVGGAEVYAHSVVEGLRARGHEVALFGASAAAEVDRPGLRVLKRPPYPVDRLVLDPDARRAFDEYVERFRPDVIHCHNLFSVALQLIERLGSCGVPLLHTIHDFQLLCPNSWCVRGDGSPCPGGAGTQCFQYGCAENYPYDSWDVLLAAVRQRLASASADIAVAPSTYLVERLRANGWRDVRRLPYFIEFPRRADVPRQDDLLLYAGRLEKEKGVHVLLEAMPEILSARPRVRLDVIGSGSRRRALGELAERLGMAHAVRFHDALPRDRLAEHYARSTMCVLPSVWAENSPLVGYECLASGLPMAGSRTGGIPELIEPGCGFTFTPGQAHDLAAQVLRFLNLSRDERERMSVAALERSRSFDPQIHLDRIESLYEEARARAAPRVMPADLGHLLPLLDRVRARGPTVPPWMRAAARFLRLPKIIRADIPERKKP